MTCPTCLWRVCMVCVISETTVCLCIHPHCRFLHVLELEDGEDMCRLELDWWEVYSKRKKARYSGLEPTTYYMYLEFKKKEWSQDGTRTHTSRRNADWHTGALTKLATEAHWQIMLGSVPFMVNLPTSLLYLVAGSVRKLLIFTHIHTLRGWINWWLKSKQVWSLTLPLPPLPLLPCRTSRKSCWSAGAAHSTRPLMPTEMGQLMWESLWTSMLLHNYYTPTLMCLVSPQWQSHLVWWLLPRDEECEKEATTNCSWGRAQQANDAHNHGDCPPRPWSHDHIELNQSELMKFKSYSYYNFANSVLKFACM